MPSSTAPSTSDAPPPRAPRKNRRRTRRPARKRHPWHRRALLFAIGVIAGAGIGVAGLLLGFGRSKTQDRGRTVEINWPEALTPAEAASLLADEGLVKSETAMAMYLRATGGTAAFVPGPHLLYEGLSPRELRRLLSRCPDRPSARVTIPEGWNRFEIAARLEKLRVAGARTFLAASADPALLEDVGIERGGAVGAESAEGYLFPATYELRVDTDAREVVRRLIGEADRRWRALAARNKDGLATLESSLGWSRRQVLTLASIVEKEAAADEERPLIASVFLNRLLDPAFRSHKLQSDPTAAYGCRAFPDEAPSCAGWSGKPTPAVVRDPQNRYSTYAHPGLPPGPIANAGEKSIAAVLVPAATKYLYFVAAGKGRHTFSEGLDDHNEGVRKLREREGP